MPNVDELIDLAAAHLAKSGVPEPRRESGSLLAFALNKDKAFLIAHPEYRPSVTEIERFTDYFKRRANREPFQHITGSQEFYGLEFEISKDVLIPRHETEIIVEQSINILSAIANPAFCEMGVGSGCISVSILHSVTTAEAFGLDISENALKVAQRNALRHGVLSRLKLFRSDIFEALDGQTFDLIASNPPYIPESEFAALQPEVRDFDPRVALTAGRDGLSIIERIVSDSPRFLKPLGFLVIEIGIGQAKTVRAMFKPEIWKTVEVLPDLQSIPRTVIARKF